MPDHAFTELQGRLVREGVASIHIARMLTELQDHYDDLRNEGRGRGMTEAEAAEYACGQIGDQRLLAERITASNVDDKHNAWFASVLLPVACHLLSPSPAGHSSTSVVMRWGASFMLGALVTGFILLAMQLSIALT